MMNVYRKHINIKNNIDETMYFYNSMLIDALKILNIDTSNIIIYLNNENCYSKLNMVKLDNLYYSIDFSITTKGKVFWNQYIKDIFQYHKFELKHKMIEFKYLDLDDNIMDFKLFKAKDRTYVAFNKKENTTCFILDQNNENYTTKILLKLMENNYIKVFKGNDLSYVVVHKNDKDHVYILEEKIEYNLFKIEESFINKIKNMFK